MTLNKQHIQRQFNRSAASYDQVAAMQRQIIDQLLKSLPSNASSIADLGCGTGYALAQIAQRYPDACLYGLDIAPNMLRLACETAPQAEFHQGDIESLPYLDNSLDVCVSSSAIQWCDAQCALTEMARVSRPGGQVLISSFLQGTLSTWRALWNVDNRQTFLTLAEFKSVLARSGLHNADVWQQRYVQRFQSFETAVSSIKELGAGNATLTRPKGLMGRHHYLGVRTQVERIIEQNGSIELEYHVVFASALKKGAV